VPVVPDVAILDCDGEVIGNIYVTLWDNMALISVLAFDELEFTGVNGDGEKYLPTKFATLPLLSNFDFA
jgi:hypothetical protein